VFAGWKGCDQVTSAGCRVLAGVTDRTVEADFNEPATLYITNPGNGEGVVSYSHCTDLPVIGRLACGHEAPLCDPLAAGQMCSQTFSAGDLLELRLSPRAGTSASWGGCDGFAGADCLVTVGTNGTRITALFELDKVRVAVLLHCDSGCGRVTSDPRGIDCGSTCAADFASNQVIHFTATADPGSTFGGWVGCDSHSSNTCTVLADSRHTVEADFHRGSTITRFAGDGTFCSSPPSCNDGGPAISAQLTDPNGVAADSAGNIYIADMLDNEVRKVTPDGTITRVAGDGSRCSSRPVCGDGGFATAAQLDRPQGVAVDSAGNVYIADTGDNAVRKVSFDGIITRVAGSGSVCTAAPGCGDNQPPTTARLSSPAGVAIDSHDNVYIADTRDHEIRKVTADGTTITRIAGDGSPCQHAPACNDGGPATSARLYGPGGVAVDATGRVYVADTSDNEVRRIELDGTITRIAGDGNFCQAQPSCGSSVATSAQLAGPGSVAIDAAGNVYVADTFDHEVREVTAGGTISLFAGDGNRCSNPPACGDGLLPTEAQLTYPSGLALDAAGNLYIAVADQEVHKVVP
jgi:sugar lactone lactonase YvrE